MEETGTDNGADGMMDHGMMDAPSGLRPPSQSPAGSFTDWILARIIDRQTTSLMVL